MGGLINRIAVDSMIYIYALEGHTQFQKPALDALGAANEILFSTLGMGEILAGIEKSGTPENRLRFLSYLHADERVQLISFGKNEALQFARLRAKYPHIKGPDAMHLATAISAGADYFLTNDARLQCVEEIEVKLLSS